MQRTLATRQAAGQGLQRWAPPEGYKPDAAAWLAQPRHWGLTTPDGDVGGAHAGYRIYPCADGRVAVAALEPHFAARLCAAAGLPAVGDGPTLRAPATHEAVANFIRTQTRAQLDALALAQDIPLHTLA